MACRSKRTSSMLIAEIRHSLLSRFTQVRVLDTRLRSEGASQPFGLRRLSNLGLRYLVCRLLLVKKNDYFHCVAIGICDTSLLDSSPTANRLHRPASYHFLVR